MQKPTLADLVGRYSQVPKRNRLLAAVVAGLLLVALYFTFIDSDQQAALSVAQQGLQKTESERAEKFAYAANLSLYETRLKELTLRLTGARAMLPDTGDVPQFLSQIGAIAKEVGLVIERFEPQQEVPMDFYAETRFALQVHGSYHEIGAFLDKVSHMDRIVNVSDLAMQNPLVQNQRVSVTGTFLLKAFRSMSADEMATLAAAAKKESKKP